MPVAESNRCRLCLVTPPGIEIPELSARLKDALAGGDVASLIIAAARSGPVETQRIAEALVPIAQACGTAALIQNDTQIAGRTRADGVHSDLSIADLKATVAALRPKKIVGAGNIHSRHDAMVAGESDVDYVLFGRLDGDTAPEIFDKALELASWWSSVFVIPAIVMGGSAISSVGKAAEAGVEFVALNRAVFGNGDPGAAVAEANQLLSKVTEPAA